MGKALQRKHHGGRAYPPSGTLLHYRAQVRDVDAQGVPAVARAALVTGITDKEFLEALAEGAVKAMQELSPGGECKGCKGLQGKLLFGAMYAGPEGATERVYRSQAP